MNKNFFSLTTLEYLVLLVCLVPLDVCAQQHQWTLRECTDYAVSHNLTIKQKNNTRRKQELQLSTAKNSRLPDLDANIGERSLSVAV